MSAAAIDLDAIRKGAVMHDVRSAERLAEQSKVAVKKEVLNLYKDELLQKVDEHIKELERLEHKKADIATIKEELLKKVEEHMLIDTLRKEEMAKFKDEMMERVAKFIETGKV
jgi:CRISPR/Cas system-associated protein Cas7 (RAMP superfamily)